MMRRNVRAAAILIAVIAAAPISSEATHASRIETAGRCDLEIATYVPVDAQRAREAINDSRFTIDEVGGVAKLLVFIELCESSADGGLGSISTLGGIGVVTDPGRSIGGCGGYDFFWPNSVENDWYRGMNDLGFRAPFVPGAKLDISQAGGVVTRAEGSVPLAEAPWSMSMTTVEPSFPELPFVSVHCHTGRRGVVRGTFDHRFTSATAGPGEVTLGDTPFWQQLGIAGRTMTLPIAAFRFTWTGPVELVTGPNSGQNADEIETQGSCYQAALGASVEAANVRELVPDEFPLFLEPTGRATVFLYTIECDDYRVNGGAPRQTFVTGVAVFVLPPDGTTDLQIYDLLMTTDSPAFYEGVTRLGLFQGFVTPTMMVEPLAGPVVSVAADTPWEHSPYAYDLTAVDAPPRGGPLPSVHWQLGSRGLVRNDYDHTDLIMTPGVGEIRAQAGSPLARILGATTASGAGGILRFSFTGVTKLADPAPQPTSSPTAVARVAGSPVLAQTGIDPGLSLFGLVFLAVSVALALRMRRSAQI